MKTMMMNALEKLGNTVRNRYFQLTVAAATLLPAVSLAQTNEKADSLKTVPAWSNTLDSSLNARQDTAKFSDYIDATMTDRGYAVNSSNNLTLIAAEDLIVRGPAEYKKYLKGANGDVKAAARNLRAATAPKAGADEASVAKARAIYEKSVKDLIIIHARDLKNNGMIKTVREDLTKGDKGFTVQTWKNKTELDKYLPANLLLKQLGNKENISNLLKSDSVSFNHLDLNNLLGTMSTHIGPTGSKELIGLVKNEKTRGDKLNQHFPQKWTDVLVEKCLLPYKQILGDEGMADMKKNLTVGGFFNALTLRYLNDQPAKIDVPMTPKEKEKYGDAINIMMMNGNIRIEAVTVENTNLLSTVGAYAGFEQTNIANRAGDYINANSYNSGDNVQLNTSRIGLHMRIANPIKEQQTGKESLFVLEGKFGLGYGVANVTTNFSDKDKAASAKHFGVDPAFFDDFKSFKAQYISPEVAVKLKAGPVYVSYKLEAFRPLNTQSMSKAEKYTFGHTMPFGTYEIGANVLQVQTKGGTFDASVYFQGADVNALLKNEGSYTTNGLTSCDPTNQYLKANPKDFLGAYNSGTVQKPVASINGYGLNVKYTTLNNRWEINAGVKVNSFNGKGGAGAAEWVKKSVSNAVHTDDWSNAQFNIGIKFNLLGKVEKISKIRAEYSETAVSFGDGKAYGVSRYGQSGPKVTERKGKLKPVRQRRILGIDLR